ncbi:ABC transporter permease [Halarsenatibacter silvermanii]|uniref:Nucleoside ABC transporter membrane protein n=1 Tax=Halarsenatibacter silvermanii TaxID=321763 RepID=A0A1G9NIH4_9FIRM|nr:ABC transporter permease [Halarsenatibacter silvermanii]SDL86406.1 nucleoside ABC transporter membrane protein [Halarsenatibacter silvermanii]
METLRQLFSVPLILSSLRFATPLVLAAIGGTFNERSGVINIGLEGMMLFGAFSAVYGTFITGNPWLGVLYAAAGGALLALILAVVCVSLKADQIVVATGINIFASGLTVYLLQIFFDSAGRSPRVPRLPAFRVLGARYNPMTLLAVLLVPIAWYILFRTPWGLRIRSVGEHPSAADSLGIDVNKYRFICVLISGVLAGLAGAHLSIGDGASFLSDMSEGRGFIALAAMIFGKWNPLGALGAALLFGYFEAVAIRVDILWLPSELLRSIPYIMTIIVLAGAIGRASPPASIGEPYFQEEE